MINLKWSKFNIHAKNKWGELLLSNAISPNFVRIKDCPDYGSDELLNKILLNNEAVSLLTENHLLIDANTDERQFVDEIYKKNVVERDRLEIFILTTNACNFNCTYCFQTKTENSLNDKQYEGILEFIKHRISGRYRNIVVNWFGGEPLLKKKAIYDFSQKLKTLCRTNRLSYGASITTNGYLLDYETFKKTFENNILSYQISLDGIPEIHNKERILKNGDGTFEKIFNNLKEIKDKAPYKMFSINIRVNFTKELYNRADEIVEMLNKEFGDDPRFIFSFIPVFDWSSSDQHNDKIKNMEKNLINMDDIINLMKKYAEKIKFDLNHELSFGNCECWAGTDSSFTFNGDGRILKCSFKLDGFEPNYVGEIDKNGNIEYNESAAIKWHFTEPMEKCYECNCFLNCLASNCGAARYEGKMVDKCRRRYDNVSNFLEIMSYNTKNKFLELEI